MSAEHKAKLKAAQDSKKAALAEQRANNDPKLIGFINEFLYPLIVTFQAFVAGKEDESEDGNVKYVRYEKNGRTSCSIEASVLWLESEFGRRAAGLFKKLFKRKMVGGWSTQKNAAMTSSWVPNDKIYADVIKKLRKTLSRNDRVKAWEFIQLIETTVEYQYVASVYFAELQKSGFYKCVGRRDSRRMLGPDKRALVKADRDVVKLKVSLLNEALKEEAALERLIHLDLEMKRRAIKTKIDQLKAEAGVTE